MSRHCKPLDQAVEQIHKGAIGDVITMQTPPAVKSHAAGRNLLAVPEFTTTV